MSVKNGGLKHKSSFMHKAILRLDGRIASLDTTCSNDETKYCRKRIQIYNRFGKMMEFKSKKRAKEKYEIVQKIIFHEL